MSRSRVTRSSSPRSSRISARSPTLGAPSACSRNRRTQFPSVESQTPSSSATAALLPPDASTNATASALNPGVNLRRLLPTRSPFRAPTAHDQVSVKTGQPPSEILRLSARSAGAKIRSQGVSASVATIGKWSWSVMACSSSPLKASASATKAIPAKRWHYGATTGPIAPHTVVSLPAGRPRPETNTAAKADPRGPTTRTLLGAPASDH
jgi:hypothetical protein